jgi:hypothetical protein
MLSEIISRTLMTCGLVPGSSPARGEGGQTLYEKTPQ